MTEYLGRGDARRSMALLWGTFEPPTRGPKQGLSVGAIVTAAIEVADADGIDALSMRKVGERLGKSAMSLYTYVPSKAELIDLMVDTVLDELPTSYPRDDGWRAAAEASARAGWELYERHPWVLQIAGTRASLGPHELASHEAQLAIYLDIGLHAFEVTRVVGAVASYVRGSAKAVADARAAEQATGMSDDEWWTTRSALLEEMAGFDWSETMPATSRLAEDHVFEQPHREPDDATPYMEREALDDFAFGLARLLDGVEALIERRRREAAPATAAATKAARKVAPKKAAARKGAAEGPARKQAAKKAATRRATTKTEPATKGRRAR